MEKNEQVLEQITEPEDNQTGGAMEEEKNSDSMESLLAQEELSLDLPHQGDIRKGVIVSISDDEILVGIGAKSEGIIPSREVSQIDPEEKANLEVGDEITVYVVKAEDSNGNLILSYLRALEEADWARAEELKNSGDLYEGIIDGYNKGGLIVKLGRLRGFVPASQVSLSRRMAYGGNTPDQRWGKMIGETIIARIIEVDRERRRLILSELAALQESREIFKERLLAEISEGDELVGHVTSLADFGAFVNINGADGLVHLTEISWEHINNPAEVLKVGQEVKVKVISIDRERKRIGLSIRQLLEDPWPQKVAQYKEGQLVQATIVRLVKFGAFARLEGSTLEGLIHISELSEQRVEHPREVVKESDVLTLRIIKIDPKQRRIGLSLRKVDSPAYAELDMEMALASDLMEEAVQTEQPEPAAAPEEEPAPPLEDNAPPAETAPEPEAPLGEEETPSPETSDTSEEDSPPPAEPEQSPEEPAPSPGASAGEEEPPPPETSDTSEEDSPPPAEPEQSPEEPAPSPEASAGEEEPPPPETSEEK